MVISISGEHEAAVLGRVSALLNAFWMRVDRIIPGNPADLFHEDGQMLLGIVDAKSRAEVEAYFTERHRNEIGIGRHTRHLCANLLIESIVENTIQARSLITVHAGIGSIPLPSRAPSTIADFRYHLIMHAEGLLISSIEAETVFIGDGSIQSGKL